MVPDLVVVLRTISDLISAFELYNAYLAAHILPYPVRYIGDPAKLDCQYERLFRAADNPACPGQCPESFRSPTRFL